jgi:hypothetical protein
MTTLAEMIEIIKAENPTLKVGNDDDGYTKVTGAEYDATIERWATNRLEKINAPIEAAVKKSALLEKLGITEEEAQLLLK